MKAAIFRSKHANPAMIARGIHQIGLCKLTALEVLRDMIVPHVLSFLIVRAQWWKRLLQVFGKTEEEPNEEGIGARVLLRYVGLLAFWCGRLSAAGLFLGLTFGEKGRNGRVVVVIRVVCYSLSFETSCFEFGCTIT